MRSEAIAYSSSNRSLLFGLHRIRDDHGRANPEHSIIPQREQIIGSKGGCFPALIKKKRVISSSRPS